MHHGNRNHLKCDRKCLMPLLKYLGRVIAPLKILSKAAKADKSHPFPCDAFGTFNTFQCFIYYKLLCRQGRDLGGGDDGGSVVVVEDRHPYSTQSTEKEKR